MWKRMRNLALVLLLLLSAIPAYAAEEESYIKWVDFDVSYTALKDSLQYDIDSQQMPVQLNWIELLAVLGAKYGGDFSRYQQADLNTLVARLEAGETIEEITQDMEHYAYYHEAYHAILAGFVGEYETQVKQDEETDEMRWETRYGLKAYSPIAKGFGYQHYDDFGASRNYGYNRRHLGHDMFGAVGTPIIAVESGVVEALGWNQYGGWRIGIRSFDGLRYYYYAHLRQNRPFHPDIAEGAVVKAGDVIGYMGRTGYSPNENVNGIKETHLHWGLQLIFHPSQAEGNQEIWVDLYQITRLLERNRSETYRVDETKEFYRVYDFKEASLAEHAKAA